MNELPNILPYNSCVMFADDITIFSAAKNLNVATVTLHNLSFNTQCYEVCKQICKKFGVMKHLRSVLPLNTISKLYYPLIQSQIDYCLSVWGPYTCPYTFLSTVQKLQNRIARFLTCKYDYKPYSSSLLRNELKWMSVSERYQYFNSILMYKCMNNPSDHLLNKFFTFTKMSISIKQERLNMITLLSINIEQNNLKGVLHFPDLKFGIILLM